MKLILKKEIKKIQEYIQKKNPYNLLNSVNVLAVSPKFDLQMDVDSVFSLTHKGEVDKLNRTLKILESQLCLGVLWWQQ